MTQQQDLLTPEENNDNQLSTGLKVLSFLIPLAGAIIYFINKDKAPAKAKSACVAALWGFGVGIVLNIIATMAKHGS